MILLNPDDQIMLGRGCAIKINHEEICNFLEGCIIDIRLCGRLDVSISVPENVLVSGGHDISMYIDARHKFFFFFSDEHQVFK